MNSIFTILFCIFVIDWTAVSSLDQTCIDRQRDIVVVLDSSDTISNADFEDAKRAISNMLSYFTIAETKVRAAMVNFGQNPKVQFDLDKYKDKASLNFAIRIAKRVGGGTSLGSALEMANKDIVSKMRDNVARIMIVVSGGGNMGLPSTAAISPLIKAQNVTIFSVGIGNQINEKELQEISSANAVIRFDNFKEMEKKAFTVTEEMCPNIDPVTQAVPTLPTEKEKTREKLVVTMPASERVTLPVLSSLKPKLTDWQTSTIETVRQTEAAIIIPDQNCLEKQRDIVVVLDSSDSITNPEFEDAKKAISAVLSYFPIAPTKTRVAMVNFGLTAKVQFDLDKYKDKASLNFAIRIAKRVGGGMSLGLALEMANQEIVSKMRDNVSRIMIVVSNGANTALPLTTAITPLIKQQNVKIFSVGIGSHINVKELQEISSLNTVIEFDNFREMENKAFTVRDEMCPDTAKKTSEAARITTTTTERITKAALPSLRPTEIPIKVATPRPATEKSTTTFEILKPDVACNETKIDLMFAFDSSSSLSEENWSQEIQLGTKIVEDLKIGKKYSQVGMLSFSSKAVLNIELGSIQDKKAIQTEMMKYLLMEGSTYMAEALIMCKEQLFEKGRPGVAKTIVLVTDGAANSPKLNVEVEAEKIKKLGVRIIVVGLGFSILKKQLINISSSDKYYPIEDMDRISVFDTSMLAKEACHIPKPVRICGNQQDIVIIIDTSSQVSTTDHLNQLLFVKDLVELFELGENRTRISLISFADGADIIKTFTTNYNDLFETIMAIKYRGGLTRLDQALAAAKKAFYLRSDGLEAKKTVILLTNGLSKEPTKSIGESYDLQEDGIDIITVGNNANSDSEELKLLASAGMDVHRNDFKDIGPMIETVAKNACNPPPRNRKTACESSGDVIFVIDKSKDSKVETWQGMKSTLLATLHTLNISQGMTRVSIIGYSDQFKTEFRLDENFNSRDIYVAIKQLKQEGVGGHLSGALRQARQLFKVNSRNNMAKALIILTDKLPDNQKEALSLADDLKTDGVKIITVGLSKDSPTSFFEELSSQKSQIPINDINKVIKHKEELRILLCDALTNKQDQCSLKVLDVIVTLDCSSSVGPDNWQIQLQFINRLVGNLDLRKGRTRMALFTFGSFVELRIPINSTFNNEEMQKEIKKIPFAEGMTAIGLAIQEGTLHFQERGRADTPQVLVVVTDGSNTKGISPQITAVTAKKAGIKIITVGIGGEISEKELKDISSSGNYYNVQDFQDLEKYNAKSITNDACQISEKPKICDGAGDLIFIMGSGSDKGTLRWNKMSDFMRTLTNLTVVGKDNTRVAVMKFNKGAYIDSGFKDNYRQFEESIELMTSSTDGVYIGKALERARTLFESDERTNATKSVIIISDSPIHDRNKTLLEAELLKKVGIKIFVIGVTQNVSRDDLGQVASKGKALFVNDFHNLNNFNAFIAGELCEVIKGTSKECSNKQLEVMIAMDSSSSIGPIHWLTQLSFVEKIIKDMDISQSMTRVGLITFNTKAYKQFGLSEFSDKYALISTIKKIEFSEGNTAIGDALRDSKLELMNNSRRGAPQVIILITDGVSKGGIPPEEESILIKKYGIKIITIGIGDSISPNQLKFLSSSSNVYSVMDYTSLKEYDSSFITRESCQAGKVL